MIEYKKKVDEDILPDSKDLETWNVSQPVQAQKKDAQADGIAQLETGNLLTVEASVERIMASAGRGFPVKDWDRYQFIEFIGEGGMGRVYKALDPNLHRHVAIKFIRGDDPQLSQRFLQEARAQAKVEHEHICKIYEVGEVDGKLYIAMQYIQGKTLAQLKDELTIEQKVKAMKEVAEAVHAAHRIGLIHRDIKPANVMMEKKEEFWHPYVMDFGLAKEMDAAGLTQSGMVVGTPWYMAPEQAQPASRVLDRRTDVYSLGATLYELLTGKPPFADAPGVEVILKVIHDEPVLPHRIEPGIPADLETMVMKCMEKELNRRYDSARALAEDLQRYLDGDAILARPASVIYRISKKARKHKALVTISGIAIVVIMMLSGYSIYSRWKTYEQANLAHYFGQQIKEAETIMRIAVMLPLHDITDEKKRVSEKINQIETDMQEAGSIAYGPGNYDIGRGYMVLHEYKPALEHLQLAWLNGYRESDVAYALGKVSGARYQEEMVRVEQEYSKSQQMTEKLKLEKEFLEPALMYLKQAQGKVGMETPEYLQALLAFYEKKYDIALKKLDRAIQKVPWLYEALVLKGDIYMVMGNQQRLQEKYDEASPLYDQAEIAYLNAIEIARSDPDAYEGLCDKRATDIFLAISRNESPEPSVRIALSACDDALQSDPASAEAYTNESNAFKRWAQYLVNRDEDPSEPARKSIETAQKALVRNPDFAYAHLNIGVAYRIMASYQVKNGREPNTAFTRACESLQKALDSNKNFFHAYNNLGMAYQDKGQYAAFIDQDPRPYYLQAVRYLEKTVEIDPDFINAYDNLYEVYKNRAEWEKSHSIDPTQSFAKALFYANKMLHINPDNPKARAAVGVLKGSRL